MNNGTTKYFFGPSKLGLKYTDEQLNQLIEDYIKSNGEFSFSQLCGHVLSIADQQDKLKKEPNTSYSQIILTYADTVKISRMLWDRIWNKELIQLFNDPRDMNHNNSETYFVAIK